MGRNIYIIITIFVVLLIAIFLNIKTPKNETKIYTVAFVSLSEVDNETFKGFKKQMKIYGWEENKNIKYLVPGAAGEINKLKTIVKNIVEKKPDLILVSSTPATQEVKRATKNLEIPVVFCPVNDPVSSNIVTNPNAPEGHITGIRLPIGDAKRFEWLNTIIPGIKNVLVPYTPNDGSSDASRKNIQKIAKSLNINIIEKSFPKNISIDDFFKHCTKLPNAIFLPRDSRIEAEIESFAKHAIANKVPLSAPSYQQVQKGALFTYGFIHTELGVDAARMVDRILKGIKPTDLPVKFGNAYLVINEKTAKLIGVEFPPSAIRNAKLIIK